MKEPAISMTDDKLMGPMIDIRSPVAGVAIMVSGGNVWVNVDGFCRLRVQRCPEVELDDNGNRTMLLSK